VSARRTHPGVYFALSFVALVSLAPLLYMARVSLGTGGSLPIAPGDWFGQPLSLVHYRDLFSGGPMGRFTLNSIVVTGIAVPIQILLAAAAGHALARVRFVGRGVFLALATAFLILPRQVTLVPLYLLLAWMGLLDTYAALILPHLADPFGVLFMAHYYQTMSPELEEAARTDGWSSRARRLAMRSSSWALGGSGCQVATCLAGRESHSRRSIRSRSPRNRTPRPST
jgi:multiple sugar transport system permease protein